MGGQRQKQLDEKPNTSTSVTDQKRPILPKVPKQPVGVSTKAENFGSTSNIKKTLAAAKTEVSANIEIKGTRAKLHAREQKQLPKLNQQNRNNRERKVAPLQSTGIHEATGNTRLPETKRSQIFSETKKSPIQPPNSNSTNKPDEPKKPVDMPPRMVRVCQELSQVLDVIFVFRANASLPLYEDRSMPKPAVFVTSDGKCQDVRGKTSNQGFAEGLLPVDDAVLGRMEKDQILKYEGDHDLPRVSVEGKMEGKIDLPTVRHKQSLMRIMEGLSQGKYSLVGAGPVNGILKVEDINHKQIPPVYFSVDLKDLNATPPLSFLKREDVVATQQNLLKPDDFLQPPWWKEEFGSWNEKIQYRYPASYEVQGQVKELLVYGLNASKPEEKPEILPITGDQDGLYMASPVDVPEWSQVPINTKYVSKNREQDGPTQLLAKMKELNSYFQGKLDSAFKKDPALAKEMLVSNPNILNDIKDQKLMGEIKENPNRYITDQAFAIKILKNYFEVTTENVSAKMLASMGTITPYEAFVANLLNRVLATNFTHIRDLMQHGLEIQKPLKTGEKPLEIGVANHVGYIDGKPLAVQTQDKDELVDLVTKTNGYGNKHIIPIENWRNMAGIEPLIQQQEKLREQFQEQKPTQTQHM